MIEKKTIIDQIEIRPEGGIQVRIGLLRVDNGKLDGSPKWHRTAFLPGQDIDAQMGAVNAHLTQMGEEAVPVSEIDRLKAHANVAWA